MGGSRGGGPLPTGAGQCHVPAGAIHRPRKPASGQLDLSGPHRAGGPEQDPLLAKRGRGRDLTMRVLGMILAGGEGSRLAPLTVERAKPAVPFAGKYRIVDFVLSNFDNSGIYALYVLTQFKSQSLVEHLQEGWQFSGILPDHFVIPVPAQMRRGRVWYRGTADAVYQNLTRI